VDNYWQYKKTVTEWVIKKYPIRNAPTDFAPLQKEDSTKQKLSQDDVFCEI
jgi:hypothetical protein